MANYHIFVRVGKIDRKTFSFFQPDQSLLRSWEYEGFRLNPPSPKPADPIKIAKMAVDATGVGPQPNVGQYREKITGGAENHILTLCFL
jgi:hypothetical protein